MHQGRANNGAFSHQGGNLRVKDVLHMPSKLRSGAANSAQNTNMIVDKGTLIAVLTPIVCADQESPPLSELCLQGYDVTGKHDKAFKELRKCPRIHLAFCLWRRNVIASAEQLV